MTLLLALLCVPTTTGAVYHSTSRATPEPRQNKISWLYLSLSREVSLLSLPFIFSPPFFFFLNTPILSGTVYPHFYQTPLLPYLPLNSCFPVLSFPLEVFSLSPLQQYTLSLFVQTFFFLDIYLQVLHTLGQEKR